MLSDTDRTTLLHFFCELRGSKSPELALLLVALAFHPFAFTARVLPRSLAAVLPLLALGTVGARSSTAEACSVADVSVRRSEPVGGDWEVEIEVCYGAGSSGFDGPLIDGATHDIALAFHGPSLDNELVSFAPAELSDVGVATGVWAQGPFPGTALEQVYGSSEPGVQGSPNVGACSPNQADLPQPGEACYHETFGVLFFSPPEGEPLSCTHSEALCGAGRQICHTITARFVEEPDALRVFGLEGNGNLAAGCTPRHAAFAAITGDSDQDGRYDGSDVCPSDVDDDADGDGVCGDVDVCPDADDLVDADDDTVPDGCDACPLDAYNDGDGDGSCDSDDSCPLDADDDADDDGICGDLEPACAADPDNDVDTDGVCAPIDVCPLDPHNDADGDGLCADVDLWDDCDDGHDVDADGTPDACDVCWLDAFNDSDGDGACDSDDACPLDPGDDSDADGTCDSDDSCAADPLDDVDGDGICGDVDPCPSAAANDADGDGICEGIDNCAGVANSDQLDADADTIGNACEPDADGDGVADDLDNCQVLANPDQADGDGDGAGDACDALDLDHDGVGDATDACLGTPLATPVDLDGCAIVQSCPPTASRKNHVAYVSCVRQAALELLGLRRISGPQAGAIVSAAASSDIGRHGCTGTGG